jgi:amino acid transporter
MCYAYKFFEIQFSRQRCKLILTIDFMYYHFLGLLELSPFYPFAETAKPIFGSIGLYYLDCRIVCDIIIFLTRCYAATNISYQMAKEGHLPRFFAKAIESTRERLFV